MSRRRIPDRSVFVDTAALLALVNSDDALHSKARRVQDELERSETRLVTSEWVLTEFLNHTAARDRRRTGVAAVQVLLTSPRVAVLPATRAGWRAALALYTTRMDKEWSLVDCTSMLLCRGRGIDRVFTHDRHFQQAGFEVLLR